MNAKVPKQDIQESPTIYTNVIFYDKDKIETFGERCKKISKKFVEDIE